MAFSFPQATVHTPVGSGGTPTVAATLGGAVAADDIMDVAVGWTSPSDEAPNGCADNLGNSYVEKTACRKRDATNGQSVTVFASKITNAGTPTVTVTWAADRDNKFITITPIRGGSLSGTPPEQGNGQTQAATTTPSSGNVTPGADGALVISSVQDVSSGISVITLESNNLSNTGETDGCATQYEIQTTAAAIAGDFTFGSAQDAITVVRSYAVASAGVTQIVGTGRATPAVALGAQLGSVSIDAFLTIQFRGL